MDGLHLNIGCGDYQAKGWTNLDIDPDIEPDIVADLRKLPADLVDVRRVYLGHVLHELLPHEVPVALADLWTHCAPGCEVIATGPDVVKVWDLVTQGQVTLEHAVQNLLGGPHRRWACTEQRLLDLLRVSGLAWATPIPLTEPGPDWPILSQAVWQCGVYGVVR